MHGTTSKPVELGLRIRVDEKLSFAIHGAR